MSASNEHRFRVIYGDTDMMGIVYYANYLRYFEAGRTELMRAYDLSYKELERLGFAMPVVEAQVRYVAPATYDDELVLRTSVAELKRASIQIEYELRRVADGALIATGATRHACVGPGGKIARLPEVFAERFDGP